MTSYKNYEIQLQKDGSQFSFDGSSYDITVEKKEKFNEGTPEESERVTDSMLFSFPKDEYEANKSLVKQKIQLAIDERVNLMAMAKKPKPEPDATVESELNSLDISTT